MKYVILILSIYSLCAASYIVEKSVGYATPGYADDPTTIGLENGFSFDTKIGEADLPTELRVEAYEPNTYGYYLVQLEGPILSAWTEQLRLLNITIYAYFPNYAYLVGTKPEQVSKIESLVFVRWVGIFQPAYKVNRELLNTQGNKVIEAQLYPDADLSAVINKIRAVGGRVLSFSESECGKLVSFEYEASKIANVAQIPEVLSLVPWAPDLPQNENSQWVCQKGWASADTSRPIWRKGIRGENTRIGFSDTGISVNHYAYRDPTISIPDSGRYPNHRKIIAYLLYPNAAFGDVGSYHGSHVGGTIAGDDSINGGTNANDGIAYKARLFFLDIGNSGGGLVTPTDLTQLYDMIYNESIVGPIRQHSGSWGRGGSGYISRDAFSDAYHWSHKDFLDIFAAGNSGPSYRSIIHPGYAKNVLAVGALQNGTSSNQIATFSSRGPTLDGRIKPTVMVPGAVIWSVDGATQSGYKSLNGTSMATPGCNASAGLIRQYLVEGWYPSGIINPLDSISYATAALFRATLIVSADPNVGSYIVPDSNIGFGRLDLDSVLYFLGDTRRLAIYDDTVGLSTSEYKEYLISVNDTTLPLRAALVWTDTAAAVGSNPNIVNNLDLQMTDPYGTYYRGNQMTGGQSIVNPSTWDTRNVEEVIRVDVPRGGTWTVRVNAQNVPYPAQWFALAITGGLTPISGVRENEILPGPKNRTAIISIFPNPILTRSTIKFQLVSRTAVSLKLFDTSGRLVETIINDTRSPDQYTVNWNIDEKIASGVYFLLFEADGLKQVAPVVVVH